MQKTEILLRFLRYTTGFFSGGSFYNLVSAVGRAPPANQTERGIKAMSTDQKTRPFGLRDQIGYAMGDFGNNFTFLFATMYLMTFCTNVLGMVPAVVGVILSASKIVDAFTDFGMGRICDTAKPTKDGRFRPWIKRMAIPMGISSMLLYQFWVSNFPMPARIA